MSDDRNNDKKHMHNKKNSLVWKIIFIISPWVIVGLLAAAWVYM